MPSISETLARCDHELAHERGDRALEILDAAGDLSAGTDAERARAVVIRVHGEMMRSDAHEPLPIDRQILLVRRALDGIEHPTSRALLFRELAHLYAFKRCDGLATRAARAAIESDPENSAGREALASVHLHFDRRDEALASVEPAVHLADAFRAHLMLARIAYVLGDFERVERELAAVPDEERTRLHVLRWRSAVTHVHADWAANLAVLDQILAETDGGYRHRGDRLRRASTLFKLGRRDDAIEAYRALWKEDENDSVGRFAREVLTTLERETRGERVVLPAFPTVTQKRNYCGPATLELVLRHLGLDGADQESIAQSVKLSHGSPMVRMTRYLERQGLAVRRFEWNAARLKACLRLGLPVILQEEYSTTTHVAVATGIDEQIGLLTVQDPMTHAPTERLIATQMRLGKLFRNSAVVAFRPDREDIARALTDAGVEDTPHIRVLDSCDDGPVDAQGSTALDPEEVIHRCRQALQHCDDYLLARLRLTDELLYIAERHPSRGNIDRFLTALRELRVRYGGDEQPHQTHARYLYWENRLEEALIEYEDALRLDPGDSNNAQAIAECHQSLGHRKEATASFWNALGMHPDHVRATENFAAHALDEGEVELAAHLSECALDMAPNNAFNHMTASRIAVKRGDREAAVAHARRAVDVAPDWSTAQSHLASVLAEDTALRPEALDILRGLVTKFPKWFRPRLDAAYWLEQNGDVDAAVELLTDGIRVADDDPNELFDRALRALEDAGRVEEALSLGRTVASERPSAPMRERWIEALRRADQHNEALEVAQAMQRDQPESAPARAHLGLSLIEKGDVAAGVEHLEHAVELAPTFRWARLTLVDRLWRKKPDDALALLDEMTAGEDPTLWSRRADLLSWHGTYEAARSALERRFSLDGGSSFDDHTAYVSALLGDGTPAALLDTLEGENDGASHKLRARLALSLALERDENARALVAKLPADDWITIELLCNACERSDGFRPLLERGAEAMIEKARREGRATPRYYAAVLAGSRASAGDRSAIETLFGSAKRAREISDAARSLDDVRHRALIAEIRTASAAREPHARVGAEQTAVRLFYEGDGARSLAHLDAAIARWPRSAILLETLAAERLFAAHETVHDTVERLWDVAHRWSYLHAIVAGAALLRAETATAKRHIDAAWRLAIANGWVLERHPLLAGIGAALAGDAAGVAKASRMDGSYQRVGAPLWAELERRARETR